MFRPLLAGVGVGPGDPDHITVGALRLLGDADVILVPTTEARADQAGRAEEIVLHHLPHKAEVVRRIPFSMAERRGVGEQRARSWEASATAAVEEFRAGAGIVAFATIGDPSVFSTFSYLSDLVTKQLDVDVCVMPGITAMQAIAASSRTPLVEGQEMLALVPATVGMDRLREVLQVVDSVTIYKGGRQLGDLRATLAVEGRLDGTLIGTDLGLDDESIRPLVDVDDERAPYFSTVLAAPRRTTTGGRL